MSGLRSLGVGLLAGGVAVAALVAIDGFGAAAALAGAGVAGAVGLADDARRRAAAAEARAAAVRDILAAGAGGCLFTWAPDGTMWRATSWRDALGLPEHGDATTWFDAVHAEDLGPLVVDLEALHRGERDELRSTHRLRHGEGWRRVSVVARAVEGPDGRVVTGAVTDITEAEERERRLSREAFLDALTGLPNRALLLDRLKHAATRSRRNPLHRVGVVLLDLDGFRRLGDTLGSAWGDEVLRSVARRLVASARPSDTVARVGGDGFAVLLDPVASADDAERVAIRLQGAVGAEIPGLGVPLTASAGVAFGHADHAEPLEVLREAEAALDQARRQGVARVVRFDPAMHEMAQRRLRVEGELRRGLSGRGIEVHYQPIVALDTGRLLAFEALARLVAADGAAITPGEFVPLAEELGLAQALLDRVLADVLARLTRWAEQHPDLHVSVNLSPQLVTPALAETIRQRLVASGVAPAMLKLELTESAVMAGEGAALRSLGALREAGVGLYVDDFGTGQSSLARLSEVRFEALKLDREFVTKLGGESAPAIVGTVVKLARDLGATVIAEGIETPAQRAALLRLGCGVGQGWAFARALPGEEADRLVAEGTCWPPG